MAKTDAPKPKKAQPKGPPKESKSGSKELDVAAEEKKLRDTYPDQKIVKGSLRDAGTIPEFGNKRTVEIHCQRTNVVFRVATSDLHQVKYSKDAIKEIRLERRKDQRKAQRKPDKAKPKAASPNKVGDKTGDSKKPAAKKVTTPARAEPKPKAQPRPQAPSRSQPLGSETPSSQRVADGTGNAQSSEPMNDEGPVSDTYHVGKS